MYWCPNHAITTALSTHRQYFSQENALPSGWKLLDHFKSGKEPCCCQQSPNTPLNESVPHRCSIRNKHTSAKQLSAQTGSKSCHRIQCLQLHTISSQWEVSKSCHRIQCLQLHTISPEWEVSKSCHRIQCLQLHTISPQWEVSKSCHRIQCLQLHTISSQWEVSKSCHRIQCQILSQDPVPSVGGYTQFLLSGRSPKRPCCSSCEAGWSL